MTSAGIIYGYKVAVIVYYMGELETTEENTINHESIT